MKRRLYGLLLLLPLGVAIAFAAPTCQQGTQIGSESSGYGQVLNNLLAGLFIVGLLCAIAGVRMLLGKPPGGEEEDRRTR
jgi:hypothetical protein